MDPTTTRCKSCFKRLLDQSENGEWQIKFQRLHAVIDGGELKQFDCPRCGAVNLPPFDVRAAKVAETGD